MIGKPTHFRLRSENKSACGIECPDYAAYDGRDVNCVLCRRTRAWRTYMGKPTFRRGDRVIAFDSLLYHDDRRTPLGVTMREAKILRTYWSRQGDRLADLRFCDGRISRAHFVSGLKKPIDHQAGK